MDLKLYQELLNEGDEYMFDLHTSASIGCEERVRDIIENSKDNLILNQPNSNGWTPLMYAACCANLRIVGLLLKKGAAAHFKNNCGHTALIIASKCGSSEAVGMLIDSGAQINDRDKNGWSALSHAAAFGYRSVAQLLIEKGAIIDIVDETHGFTPLMLSSAAGHEMIVRDLLQLGVNPNIQSKSGDTARSLAAQNSHFKVTSLLDDYVCAKKNYPSTKSKISNHSSPYNLQMLLKEYQLSKYYCIFEKHDIDLDTFWMLSENDLKEIGIQILGPRKKMCSAIAQWYQTQMTSGNPDTRALCNKLLLENRRLQQNKEELESAIYREIEMRKAAEQNLNEGIKTLKNFSDTVQRTVSYTVVLEERLKQCHDNLKKILSCTQDSNWSQIRRDVVLPLVDHMEKLINDIQQHSQLSLQQTKFKC